MLERKEGEGDQSRLAWQRNTDKKQQVRLIKDGGVNVVTGSTRVMERWEENFEELMIEGKY